MPELAPAGIGHLSAPSPSDMAGLPHDIRAATVVASRAAMREHALKTIGLERAALAGGDPLLAGDDAVRLHGRFLCSGQVAVEFGQKFRPAARVIVARCRVGELFVKESEQ